MTTSFDKSELLKEQVISKIHWGARESEVIQWLDEEKGVFGREAEDLLAHAWRERRKEIRLRAIMTRWFRFTDATACDSHCCRPCFRTS